MAKAKQSASKTPKKRSTKYSKLQAVCSKELTAKKKALVLAEKRLAKAQKTHTDLLAEVARLDMLERSLKAVNEGLEPPQSVRYVYTYPQWVYQPGWYWNGGSYTWTSTPNTTIYNGNFQGGQQYSNLNGTYGVNTINCTTSNSIPVTSTITTTADCSNAYTLCNTGSAGSILTDSAGTLNWQSVPTTPVTGTSYQLPALTAACETVDLSTGATLEDEVPESEVLDNEVEEVKS
jgi:hypothetical protein